MKSDSVGRLPRIAAPRALGITAAAALAAVAAIGTSALGASPANAATTQDITLSLSPTSGTNFATDTGKLTWTTPSACVGSELDAFLYSGISAWNSTAINAAEGNGAAQQTYFNFFTTSKATAAADTAAWPNVSAGYTNFSTSATVANTADLVSSLGTGLYTIAVACVNPTTHAPILDSSGNPVTGTMLLNVGASGNSFAVETGVGTQVALTGSGTAGGTVSLTAAVTAASGTPTGTVNFFAGDSATGKPLNSSPVTVTGGKATFSGANGYASDDQGAQAYTAVFTPASTAAFAPSSVVSSADLIAETVKITVAAKQASGTSLVLTATATGTPTALLTKLPDAGVDFVVDGNLIDIPGNPTIPFVFNSAGVATHTVTGLKTGVHTVTAILTDGANHPEVPATGFATTINTVNAQVGTPATTTKVTGAASATGWQVTATVSAPTGNTASPAGTVAFKDGSTSLGSATLKADGAGKSTATVIEHAVTAGAHTFAGAYTSSNAANFANSSGTLADNFPVAITWVQPGTVTISGTAKEGDTLTAKSGAASPSGVRLVRQWFANGTAISGATGTTLKLGAAEVGKTVTVEVTGFKTGDVTVSVTSAATAKVAKS